MPQVAISPFKLHSTTWDMEISRMLNRLGSNPTTMVEGRGPWYFHNHPKPVTIAGLVDQYDQSDQSDQSDQPGSVPMGSGVSSTAQTLSSQAQAQSQSQSQAASPGSGSGMSGLGWGSLLLAAGIVAVLVANKRR